MPFITFISYFLACSAVFSYGIGVNFLLQPQERASLRLFKMAIRTAAAAFLSSAILWFPFSVPRLAAALSGLLPLAVAAVSFGLSTALSALLPESFAGGRQDIPDALFVFSIAFLSLKEGLSFPDALLISLSCSSSFALFLFLLMAALSRISPLGIPESRLTLPLALVLLGLFSFIQPLFDIIWSLHVSSG